MKRNQTPQDGTAPIQPATPLCYSIDGAAVALGTNRTAVYSLIAEGELRSIKLKKRRLVPVREVTALIERRLAGGG